MRGKLRGEFGVTRHEPQAVQLRDQSVGNGWDMENSQNFSRWLGLRPGKEAGENKTLAPKPYVKVTAEGKTEQPGHPCWKIAWEQVYRKCTHAVIGNLETLEGGMAEMLGELSSVAAEKARRNVNDFLANYTYVYWREHFIQHDLAEADINIQELASKHLRAGVREDLDETDVAKAGAAAQAIDRGEAVGGDAVLQQVVLHGGGAALTQREVILGRATLVAVAFDRSRSSPPCRNHSARCWGSCSGRRSCGTSPSPARRW